MKTYKTMAYDKGSKIYVVIESDYPNKNNFINDIRKNGYKVDPVRVKEAHVYDYIMNETNAEIEDWKNN